MPCGDACYSGQLGSLGERSLFSGRNLFMEVELGA